MDELVGRIRVETWRSLSHVTGPRALHLGILFGVAPKLGPRVVRILASDKTDAAFQFDHERCVSEILAGVAEANEKFGGTLEVEAIQFVPNDYPGAWQAKYVAYVLARQALTGEDFGVNAAPIPPE